MADDPYSAGDPCSASDPYSAGDPYSADSESFEIVNKLRSLPICFSTDDNIISVNFANHLWIIQVHEIDDDDENYVFLHVNIEPEISTGESAEIIFPLHTGEQCLLELEGPPNPKRKFGPLLMPISSILNRTFTIKFEKKLMKPTNGIFTLNNIPSAIDLLKNVAQLYRNKEFCDVMLKVGMKEFPAHKTILAAASPVFRAMFANKFREAHTNVVELEDSEPNAIKEMLQFIYTHKNPQFSSSSSDIYSLYEAAHKYDISCLLKLCVDELSRPFNIETALDRLVLADKYSDMDLKQRCLNFICENPPGLAMVLEKKQYLLQRPRLLEDILTCKFEQK